MRETRDALLRSNRECFNPLVCGDTDAGPGEERGLGCRHRLFQSPRLRGYGCGLLRFELGNV